MTFAARAFSWALGAELLVQKARSSSVPEDLENFPNLLAGSFTDGQKFSTGNTLPLVGRPWGFNHWSPQSTDGRTSWWFRGDKEEFHWLRLTHQPSPWIGDWGWAAMGPQMGNLEQNPTMFFEPWSAWIKPYVFDATLGPDNMRIQMAPTMHAAIMKVTFPSHNPMGLQKRVCFRYALDDEKARKKGGVHGSFSSSELWLELQSIRAEDVPPGFGMYLRAEVEKESLQYRPEGESMSTNGAVRCFNFSPKETTVVVRVGTSLISYSQAVLNLKREVAQRSFDEVEDEGRLVWREMLGRVRVVDAGMKWSKETFDRLTIFYTGLYRAMTFPRRLDEVDENGRVVHYSPYDPRGRVHEGILVTDNGFWDTFRTVYPLLNLAYPKEAGEIVAGWLNAFKEGGWLPEWSSPGYRNCMVGTYGDVILADAILKGVEGFDPEVAWQAMSKDSFEAGEKSGKVGKKFYGEYVGKGYIPIEVSLDAASATLDFAFSDYAVSFVAERLGKTHQVSTLRNRALNARNNLFDSGWGLMRARKANGDFKLDNPVAWGNGFVEGAAWQHSFPPFDLQGLARLHGSREALARKILQMWTTPGSFQPGSYRRTIHEMEEMRALGMGQYAHSNQPVHHVAWLLLALDDGTYPACKADAPKPQPGTCCPRRAAEEAIHDTLRRAYSTEFFAGDEDNGEMGSWYVLAALGLFDPAPGTPHGYALGSPLFRKVELRRGPPREDGSPRPPDLTIFSDRAGGREVAHVSRVLLNGKDIGLSATQETLGWRVSADELLAGPGAQLRFVTAGEDGQAQGRPDEEITPGDVPQPLPPIIPPKPIGGPDELHRPPPAHPKPPLSSEGHHDASKPGAPHSAAADERLRMQHVRDKEMQRVAEEQRDYWKHEADEQKEKIHNLELQLHQHHQNIKVETDMNAGLAHLAQVGLVVLLLVNITGWLICMWFRDSRSSSSSATGSHSSHGSGSRRPLRYHRHGSNKVAAPVSTKKESVAV